ncbi:MAG: hypothetical protein A2293_02435 [Elusimicrobia bacterium RIFOXYB2_FULL_49_7]|nr:MAG: hypothetical protein A2293_02435 [Elusimicrobia bacterium RIFOXYB2_FULL_49_7]
MTPLLIIQGDNTLEKEQFIRDRLSSHPDKGNLSIEYGDEISGEAMISGAGAPSLFGGGSLRLIRGSDALTTEDFEGFADLIRRPSPDSTVILEGKKPGSRLGKGHPFIKAMADHADRVQIIHCQNPPSYQIPQWISEQARKRFGRPIDKAACDLLHSRVGDDLPALMSEMTKLDIVLPAKKSISAEAVEHYAAMARVRKTWDLPPLLARKEAAEAFLALRNLYDYNHNTLQILSAISDHFFKLCSLHAYFAAAPDKWADIRQLEPQGASVRNQLNPLVADALNAANFSRKKVSPQLVYPLFVLPKIMLQLTNYSLDQCRYILRLTASFDLDLKSGRHPDGPASMEGLLYYILYSDRFRTETWF